MRYAWVSSKDGIAKGGGGGGLAIVKDNKFKDFFLLWMLKRIEIWWLW